MKTGPILVIASLALIAIGCSGGGGGFNPATFSSGVAIPGFDFSSLVAGFGPQAFFLASEAAQGNADLNGDGDAADNVVHMVDTDTAVVTNTGVSGRLPLLRTATRVVWKASEIEEGGVDLNSDGDAADHVMVTFDPALPVSATNPLVTTVSAYELAPLDSWADMVVVITRESDIGVDLNTDGDMIDDVVQLFDATTGTATNTGVTWDADTNTLEVGNGVAAWVVDEADVGAGVDLNGDGDMTDTVVFGADLTLLTTFPVGPGGSARAAAFGLPPIMGTTAAPVIGYAINEAMEGNVSFNGNTFVGDTDTNDDVIALFDVNTATEAMPFNGVAVDPDQTFGNATRCVFVAGEDANTGSSLTDFNSDLDNTDEVAFWLDLAAPVSVNNLGLAAPSGDAGLRLCDEFVVFLADEASQGPSGTNLNATSSDTDASDTVAFYTDISAVGNANATTEFAATDAVCFTGGFFLLVPESAQGGQDVNGDGDSNDIVPVYFIAAGPGIIPGIEVPLTDGPVSFQICPSVINVVGNIAETNGFGDLNEDGDEDDFHIRVTRVTRSTGHISRNFFINNSDLDGSAFAFILDGDTTMWPSAEQNVGIGVDMNGDGDFSDSVLRWYNGTCF